MADVNLDVRGAVELRRFPVELFLASEEQWGALLREYVLRSFGAAEQPYDADEVGRANDALSEVGVALAAALGEDTVPTPPYPDLDLTLDLETATTGDFGMLQGILDDAHRLARSGELLTLPSLPEVVALRDWICEQVVEQTAGAESSAWRFSIGDHGTWSAPAAEWDGIAALAQDTSWLVGDDHNRIVAASRAALELLGWDEQELVGQRILAVIPPEWRERHVAGFTRSVVTGDDRLLHTPLPLAALTRSGEEVDITLTLSRHRARRGRTVYLARLEPRP